MERLRSRLSYANKFTGPLALFLVVAGGSAWAANEWSGENIVDHSLTSVDIKNEDIRAVDVRDASRQNGGLSGAEIVDDSLEGTDIDESTLSPTGAGGPAGGDLAGSYPDPEIKAGAIVSDDVAFAFRTKIAADSVHESVDPEPDPLLDASSGVPISKTVNFTESFNPIVIASLETYASTSSGQAECALWGGRPGGSTDRLSQNGVVDFAFVNDNEHLTLAGEFGRNLNNSGTGYSANIDIAIEVRCSVASGTVHFERGDLIVMGMPLSL